MKAIIEWLDQRTGIKGLTREALFEKVPGGARWRYVWGSTLVFCFFIQVITGVVLWMAYNPSSTTAWESVYYIQHEMWGGWIVRGIHHFTAQAMNILLVLHLLQVVIDGAYKAPREVNFWTGLILLQIVMGLSLTGYLLPWDQKGYWATKVATNIAAITPVIGPGLQKVIVGGVDYGHHTLTRFFALHAGVLPASLIALIGFHVYLFRRHGLTVKQPRKKPDTTFWPDQVLKDGVICLAVLAVILFFVVRNRGAELGAPADPSEQFSAARPEWYFLFLFQFLKYFPGTSEIWGAMIIPGILFTMIGAMPIIARHRLGHRFNVVFLAALMVGVGVLTVAALKEDAGNPTYQAAVRAAHLDSERIIQLAGSPSGIPREGAVELLRNDPLTQGPKLFAKNCASCHRFGGHDGLGGTPADPASAPDLKEFASRGWIQGLLDPAQVDSARYFGGTKHKEGKMVRFVKRDIARLDETERAALKEIIAALSAEAGLMSQAGVDAADAALIESGRKRLIAGELRCTECHSYRGGDDEATAPTLTGYGSREWLTGIINDPTHSRFYGKRNDRMPAFGTEMILDPKAVGLLADWLRGEWYVPPVAAR